MGLIYIPDRELLDYCSAATLLFRIESTPTEEKVRKLKKVRDLWQDIMEVQEIRDVFTGQPVKKKKYDIDHFIP